MKTKNIRQSVIIKATPREVYEALMDSIKHSEFTRSKASISRTVGGAISAYDGYITGKTLQLIKKKMIVQSWRSSDFKSNDLDSILILCFEKKGNDAKVNMMHANVPDHQYLGVKGGWNYFYWKPWRKYINGSRQ